MSLPFMVVIGLPIGKDRRMMQCAGCGRKPGNNTIEAQFLFMSHEFECLEVIHANELASL